MSLRAKLARMQAPPAAVRAGPGAGRLAGGEAAPPAEAEAGPRLTPPAEGEARPLLTPSAEGEARPRPTPSAEGEAEAGPRPTPPAGAQRSAGRVVVVPASFEAVETPEGLLYRRLVRYGASHPVGRGAIGPAARARAAGLSRLALDPALSRLDPASFLYLDTETTGLAGGTGTIAFLIGLASFDGEGWALEQLLVPQPGEEAPALARVAAAIEASGCLVTYNGKSFDLPLLRARFALNRRPPPAARPHLDLMHVARRLHGARLGRCPLRAIEGEVLGFERPTTITSAEVVGRYRAFLRSGEGALLDEVAEHNAADILSLVALVALYDDPLAAFCPDDLVALARTWSRAGAPAEALSALDGAARRGAGPELYRARAEAALRLGDDARAAEALAALLVERDEGGTRLRLAKLYEHGLGRPDEALRLVERGTGEGPPALERRRLRLARKVARPAQPALPGFEALLEPAARRPRARRASTSVLALREGEQGGNLRLDRLELADGELDLRLAQPPRGVDEIE